MCVACVTSTFAGAACAYLNLRDTVICSNILKTLNNSDSVPTSENLEGLIAAQPCSYIYPIYSVVKNRRAADRPSEDGAIRFRTLGRA